MTIIARWIYDGHLGIINNYGQLILDNNVNSGLIVIANHNIIIKSLGAKIGIWTDTGKILISDGSKGRWLKEL